MKILRTKTAFYLKVDLKKKITNSSTVTQLLKYLLNFNSKYLIYLMFE